MQRREGLIEAEVDGEMVGLHVEKGTCYGFNGTATRIWSMIEAPRRLSELRDDLVREFDVNPDECEAQLAELLRELEADGLVELRPVPGDG
ncbi:MAG TPA: PqqD family peptide modification chaperone [Allosphingosinicella sp.]